MSKKVKQKDINNENNLKENLNKENIKENQISNSEKDIENTKELNKKSKNKEENTPNNDSKNSTCDINKEEIKNENKNKIKNKNKNENENQDIVETTTLTKSKKSHKTFLIISLSILFIFLLFFIFSTIFALITSSKSTIINGMKIKDIDVSGLTKQEAIEKVSNAFKGKLENQITLTYNDYSITVFPEQFDVSFSIEEAINIAYEKGRSPKNIFKNNYEILSSMLFGTNINPGFSYSEETLDSLIAEMEINFPNRLIESNYYIENNNLILSKGKNGVVIDRNKLKSELIYLINSLYYNTCTITIPVTYKEATPLNISKIHKEVYRAPQDAYYTTNPYVVYPHIDGVDFAISIEEATTLLNEEKEQYTIPLKVLSPNITTNQIGTEAFPNLLGSYSTTFNSRNVNRTTNIKLATNKINGIVIMPGETFSYNQTVGKRTAAAGFKSAAVYVGGEVTTGIGGGICQVSSTLYNAVLLANLEIVERHNHGFDTGYVPVSRDATVSWGGPDFKFKNTRNYPVKLVCSVSGGRLSTQVFGLKSDNEYEVEIVSYVTQYIKYKTITKDDPSLAKGTQKVIQNGSNGCKSVAYRILKQNGEVISKTLLSKDTYNPHNKIISVGIQ